MLIDYFLLEMHLSVNEIYAPVQPLLQRVEGVMQSQAENYHPDLKNALNLILSSGGKRIRAAITLLSAKMLGGEDEPAVILASAIEMLHTATLVHDDLIDGSLLRRGMPTLNSQWSPGATVLTGDFLFARAAKLAAETNSVAVMRIFAETLSIIVNGEIAQLFSQRYLADSENYYSRIYAKTASLFETACKASALLSNSPQSTQEALGTYGYNIGVAFQIIDDILDFKGEQLTLGKPVGSDLRQGLITLPALIYMDRHPDDPHVSIIRNNNCLDDLSQTNQLIHDISNSEAIALSLEEAHKYIQNGITALSSFPNTPEKSSLLQLANYIVSRNI
jgi:geranylgeranyl pyrophosphate synthase